MLIATFIVLSGCATPYQRESVNYSGGGYFETKIDSNILKNILKRDAVAYVRTHAILSYMRAHSLDLDNNIFQVSFLSNGATTRERTSDLALLRSAEVALEHGFRYFIIVKSHNQIYVFSNFRITNTILCFKKRPEINELIFDAKSIAKSIRKKYRITK